MALMVGYRTAGRIRKPAMRSTAKPSAILTRADGVRYHRAAVSFAEHALPRFFVASATRLFRVKQ